MSLSKKNGKLRLCLGEPYQGLPKSPLKSKKQCIFLAKAHRSHPHTEIELKMCKMLLHGENIPEKLTVNIDLLCILRQCLLELQLSSKLLKKKKQEYFSFTCTPHTQRKPE